jgi:hypothetical protein
MAGLTADQLYALIKQYEGVLPIPVPYVTINVGTFDAVAGTWTGLTTTVTKDPEPVEHLPNQHPKNPPPRYVGPEWISETIDAQWHMTITSVPAPLVAVAPVLLQFTVANASTPWSVTVGGSSHSAPAGQNTLIINVWDREILPWTIQAGAKNHVDSLRIQRKASIPAVGAFTIPVIPAAIVYAPPADSQQKSSASYGTTDTVGTTISWDFSTDTSESVEPGFTDGSAFRAFLSVVSTALGAYSSAMGDKAGLDAMSSDPKVSKQAGVEKANSQAAASVSKDITSFASLIPSETMSDQQGKVEDNGGSLTATYTQIGTLGTSAKGGGPGAGDNIIFYKNVRVAWAYNDGEWLLCPLGGTLVSVTAAALQNKLAAVGISSDDQKLLLALDPFVAGGPNAELPNDRFTVPPGVQDSIEYGGGATFDQKYTVTRDSKTTTTTKTYTTDTSTWEPGTVLRMFGFGTDKTQKTTTLTNATGSEVSDTVTLDANLVSGPDDVFVVSIRLDTLFGTWAFQQFSPAGQPIVSGKSAQPGEHVRLEAGGKVHVTVANGKGEYAFRAPTIATGRAQLFVNGQPAKTLQIGSRTRDGQAGAIKEDATV